LRGALRNAGVGGLFHFLAQDSQGETRQTPTLYVLGDYDRHAHVLKSEYYKLARLEHCLLVDDPIKNQTIICADSHSDFHIRLDGLSLTEDTLKEFASDHADVFAFGFTNSELFDRAFVHVRSAEGVIPVRASDGRMSAEMLGWLETALGIPAGGLSSPVDPTKPTVEAHRAQRTILKSN
jgi:hypothetical protein